MMFWTKAKLDRHIAEAILARDVERRKECVDPSPLPSSYDAEEEAMTLLALWRERVLPADEIVRRCDLHAERHPRDIYYGYGGLGLGNPAYSTGAAKIVTWVRLEANAEATKLAAKAAKDALEQGSRHA